MAKASPSNASSIVEEYSKKAHKLVERKVDFLLLALSQMIGSQSIVNPSPEFQRRLVWSDKKKSRFIESLLIGLPVPPLFLFEIEPNHYEVMDGQQRITAIGGFYQDEVALVGLEQLDFLNDRVYSRLPKELQRSLDRCVISTVNVSAAPNFGEDKGEIRREVFKRLNTGGVSLNPQELLNCLYSGPLNELVVELSCFRRFTEAWGIPAHTYAKEKSRTQSPAVKRNRYYARMEDCALVLRFLSMRDPKMIRGSVRAVAEKFMRENRNMPKPARDELGRAFRSRVDLAVDVFADDAFKYTNKKGKVKVSAPLFDAELAAMDRLYPSADKLRSRSARIRKAVKDALSNKKTFSLLINKANTAAAVRKRLRLMTRLVSGAAGL
jgi:hypothetical protein